MKTETVTLKVSGSAGFWLSSCSEALSLDIRWSGDFATIKIEDIDTLIKNSREIPKGWTRRSGAAARVDRILSGVPK